MKRRRLYPVRAIVTAIIYLLVYPALVWLLVGTVWYVVASGDSTPAFANLVAFIRKFLVPFTRETVLIACGFHALYFGARALISGYMRFLEALFAAIGLAYLAIGVNGLLENGVQLWLLARGIVSVEMTVAIALSVAAALLVWASLRVLRVLTPPPANAMPQQRDLKGKL